ncbi:hypothetical protein AVEN_252103-1 [Araneus ventricosus]|uniref:Uncharacterized protein n=1 Tax=Araneus ventricosus TaxID=182803 RepID=A0A4Y2LUU6_ARAVE|nr:hypothetical protein AVEN_252103-1 [Araneus ventricosus]
MRKLEVVGRGGTVINTGWKNGVINRIENHVGRPLQWSICLLHFNELPFRHIFQHIDDQTARLNCFSGPIGQQLTCYEKLPVFDYEPIDCSIIDIERNMLSKGQQYLLDILNAATSRNCPEDLANRDPGPLFHSRWLTAANRVLRLNDTSKSEGIDISSAVKMIDKTRQAVIKKKLRSDEGFEQALVDASDLCENLEIEAKFSQVLEVRSRKKISNLFVILMRKLF